MTVESFLSIARSLWTVWFAAIFTGICIWAYWPRSRDRFQKYGEIPLSDDDSPAARRRKG